MLLKTYFSATELLVALCLGTTAHTSHFSLAYNLLCLPIICYNLWPVTCEGMMHTFSRPGPQDHLCGFFLAFFHISTGCQCIDDLTTCQLITKEPPVDCVTVKQNIPMPFLRPSWNETGDTTSENIP